MDMSIKTAEKECVARFEEFITKDIDMETMFWTIDTIMSNYTRYIIEDNSFCGGYTEESRRLYDLKMLRDLFIKPKE